MRESAILLVALFAMASSSRAVNLGFYDFNRTFGGSNTQAFEHVFVSWVRYTTGPVYCAMAQAQSKNRWLLLSLEPWADPAISPNPSTLLADVVAGKYDRALLAVCKDIATAQHPLFVRWGVRR